MEITSEILIFLDKRADLSKSNNNINEDITKHVNDNNHNDTNATPTISRMDTPKPKDGHLPEEIVVQTWNLALKINSQSKSQVSS